SLTCENVNGNIQQTGSGYNNDLTNNGTVTDQGCEGNIYIFNGQTFDCRLPGIEDGFADCCESAKDWLGLGKCWQNEVELQQKKSAGFCHYVGTYCTAKFLGICLQEDKAYCCFDGVLARIIQEQGRYQGLPQYGWGTAESPDCEGFTPTQFQALDWSKINLSEYYAYIEQTFVPQMQNTVNNAVNNMENKLESGYQSQ
ncbi:MAG: conjugal transfer protein TraN, partial [Conexivisphaerales archaeon]